MIHDINIIDYKCFENFRATGFQRVNLIGGQNNVGKTAFIEACYIVSSANKISNLLHTLSIVERNRDKLNISISEDIHIIEILESYKKVSIESINNIYYEFMKDDFNPALEIRLNDSFHTINFKNKISFEKSNNSIFIDNFGFTNSELKEVYKSVQFQDKDVEINRFLENFNFINPKFKIIDDTPYLKTDDNDEYTQIKQYGDGIKHYISIICSLYSCKDGFLFIDEIENGIHYTLYEKLWEIILQVSKEQNVQVFVTTHSKESIDSFNRVSKKYESKDILYLEIGKNKKSQELFMRDLDSEQLEYELSHQGRYRGE
ncbi:MAG: AAA family ATPase [Campylobacterota bacterium]|nr:AAA family ATPase [Campylobacterota bacterium]